MKCPSCGFVNNTKAQYCSSCGKSLLNNNVVYKLSVRSAIIFLIGTIPVIYDLLSDYFSDDYEHLPEILFGLFTKFIMIIGFGLSIINIITLLKTKEKTTLDKKLLFLNLLIAIPELIAILTIIYTIFENMAI